mgnify:FL=1
MENLPPRQKEIKMSDDRVFAAISYIGILCLIALLLKKNDRFIEFHAKQGLVLFFAEVVIFFVNIIPFLGQMVWFLASILFLIFSVVGIIKSLQGEMWKMPILHDFSKKINL